MQSIETLRTELGKVAGEARRSHIGGTAEYDELKAQVGELIEQIETMKKSDPTPSDAKIDTEIRDAKICARILTKADLDQETFKEEAAGRKQAVVRAHRAWLKKKGLPTRTTKGTTTNPHRQATCYSCKNRVSSTLETECSGCQWIICRCGACGCEQAAAAAKAAALLEDATA